MADANSGYDVHCGKIRDLSGLAMIAKRCVSVGDWLFGDEIGNVLPPGYELT
jgi:hypothetical protein